MTSKELEKIIENLKRLPGQIIIPSAPVIHEGFPSCFNLSFAEYELYHSFGGQYLDYNKDLLFSKSQPCIRHQDWKSILEQDENSYRYLSVFEMVDVGGMLVYKDKSKQLDINKIVIDSFLDFLSLVGLKKENLVISYFVETSVASATKNKYMISKKIPTDPMVSYWIEKGLDISQFTPDRTRDTFLSLNIFGKPTPWGYRNEIHYRYKGNLLDIATVEYLPFRPVFLNGNIIDVIDNKHAVAVSAIGFERVLMVINELDHIWEVDSIKPLVDLMKEIGLNKKDQIVFTQAIRAIHQVVADGGLYVKLNKRRKEYMRRLFYSPVCRVLKKYNLDNSILEDALKLNAKLQNKDKLKNSVLSTIDEINIRKNSFVADKSLKIKKRL